VGVILKQELTARSAVVTGLLAAVTWLLLVFVGGEFDWWSALVLPVGVGLAGWLFRVCWIGLKRERRLRTLTELSSTIEPSSPEWNWFERAWLTTTRLGRLARRALPEPLAARLCKQVDATARDLYQLAGFVSELTRRIKLIDGAYLAGEAARLRLSLEGAAPETEPEIERSLSALSDTQDVLDRLGAAREAALAKLAAGTHVLEELHARTLELSALVKAARSAVPDRLDDLALELEGLRQGMSEAVSLSRSALGTAR
jgi:hypothetical protein